MSPVNPTQSFVASTLHAILHQYECMSGQIRKILQQSVEHTIGASTDNNPHDTGVRQRLLILLLQNSKLSIRVRISLKIGQIVHLRIFTGKKSYPLFQLGSDTLPRMAIIRTERLIVAISTTTDPNTPVPIRASKPCM